eukprot:5919577-Heterocapsa_arctica.AAC.2
MALGIREYEFPVEPAQEKVGNQDKKEWGERAPLSDPRFKRESLIDFPAKFDIAEIVHIQTLDYQAYMGREARPSEYFVQ